MEEGKFRCMKCQGIFNIKDGKWGKYNNISSLMCKDCKKKQGIAEQNN